MGGQRTSRFGRHVRQAWPGPAQPGPARPGPAWPCPWKRCLMQHPHVTGPPVHSRSRAATRRFLCPVRVRRIFWKLPVHLVGPQMAVIERVTKNLRSSLFCAQSAWPITNPPGKVQGRRRQNPEPFLGPHGRLREASKQFRWITCNRCSMITVYI